MKSTERAATRAEKILEKARKDYAEIQNNISEYTIKVKNAAAEMEKAEAACNLSAYTKARNEKNEAEAALEMYSNRAEKMESEPLIPEADYLDMTNEIIKEFDEYVEGLRCDLYEITADLIAKHDAAHAELQAANNALHTLQFDLYRGFDLEYGGPNGDIVHNQSKKTVGTRDQYEVLKWADSIAKGLYEKMTAEREKLPEVKEVANDA